MAEARLKHGLDRAVGFVGGVGRRFMADDCLRAASALSYTTVLSLVPLAAVVFALASVFPATAEMLARIEAYTYSNFMPDLGAETITQIRGFIGNTGRLGVLSAVFLVVTAALLLATIEDSLNAIWRVVRPRPPLQKVLTYWTMVTLGPLLFGASLSLSGYAFALGQWVGIDSRGLPLGQLALVLPWLLELVAFTLMYTVIPNRTVRLRHGLIGALVATFAFELLKKGFGYYVVGAADYRTLYGALAAVPLFLIWMYLSWATTLIGAEVAAFLPEWNVSRGLGGTIGTPRRRLQLAIAVLALLSARARSGRPTGRKRLRDTLPVPFTELSDVLGALEQGRFITQSNEQWWLSRDLAHASLHDVLRALGLSHDQLLAEPPAADTPVWTRRLHERLSALAGAEREIAAIRLADLLAEAQSKPGPLS
jgi:membrane protein